MVWESVLKRLANQELILPYLERSILAENWPDSYSIEIDSGEYYGKGDGYFHPSTHSLLGARELYYRFHPDTRDEMVYERHGLRIQMAMALGSSLHGVLQTQMQMCGLVTDPKDIEVEYIIEDHHVRGRTDWVVHHPNGDVFPVEMKTRDTWLFKRQTEIEPSWDIQLSMAEYALGYDHGIVLMLERGGGSAMREFPHKRNDAALEEVFAKFDYVRAAIEANEPPPHCCMFDSPQMQSCPARHECWLKT
jgi:hypothetical protein